MNKNHEELIQILNELENIHYPPGIQFQSKSNILFFTFFFALFKFEFQYDLLNDGLKNFIIIGKVYVSFIFNFLKYNKWRNNIVYYLYLGLQQYKALYNQKNNELAAIYNLVQSHSPGLRNKAALRYEKCLSSDVEHVCNVSLNSVKEDIALKCPTEQLDNSIRTMLKQVEAMPKGKFIVLNCK